MSVSSEIKLIDGNTFNAINDKQKPTKLEPPSNHYHLCWIKITKPPIK